MSGLTEGVFMTNKEQREVTGSAPVETPPQGDQAWRRKRANDLSDLLGGITDDNMHPEQDTGEPQGNEQW